MLVPLAQRSDAPVDPGAVDGFSGDAIVFDQHHFGLLVAFLLDNLPPQSRYLIVFTLGGAAGVLDMLCFRFVEEVYTAAPRRMKLGRTLKAVYSNKPFMRLLMMWTVWCFTANLAGPYLTPYARNVMGLSFTQIDLWHIVS